MLRKIKAQIGEKRFAPGLITAIIARLKGHFGTFALLFLVIDRLFVIFSIDLGLSEAIKCWLTGIEWWQNSLIILGGFALLVAFVYLDLKFFLPGEVATNSRRNVVLREIQAKLDKIGLQIGSRKMEE